MCVCVCAYLDISGLDSYRFRSELRVWTSTGAGFPYSQQLQHHQLSDLKPVSTSSQMASRLSRRVQTSKQNITKAPRWRQSELDPPSKRFLPCIIMKSGLNLPLSSSSPFDQSQSRAGWSSSAADSLREPRLSWAELSWVSARLGPISSQYANKARLVHAWAPFRLTNHYMVC